jgi:hypothetical protein
MKKTRFTESQILSILKEAEPGITSAALLRDRSSYTFARYS